MNTKRTCLILIALLCYRNDLHASVTSQNPTPLYDYIQTHRANFDLQEFEQLIIDGASPNERFRTAHFDENTDYDATLLHFAARRALIPMMEILLKHHADVDATNGHDRTALHIATLFGRDNAVSLLLKHHANPNSQDRCGSTPLFFAIYNNKPQLAKDLLQHGADQTIKDGEGAMLLEHAIEYHNDTLAEFLKNDPATKRYYEIASGQESISEKLYNKYLSATLQHAITQQNTKAITTLKRLLSDHQKNIAAPAHDAAFTQK